MSVSKLYYQLALISLFASLNVLNAQTAPVMAGPIIAPDGVAFGVGDEDPLLRKGEETTPKDLELDLDAGGVFSIFPGLDTTPTFRAGEGNSAYVTASGSGSSRGEASIPTEHQWYRIAKSKSGDLMTNALFSLRDNNNNITFRTGMSDGAKNNMSFTLLSNSSNSNYSMFAAIRYLSGGNQQEHYLEVKIEGIGDVSYSIMENLAKGGWVPVDWTETNAIPAGYTETIYYLHKLFVVAGQTPILSVDRGGVAIAGNLNVNGSSVMTAASLDSLFSGPMEFGFDTSASGANSVAFGYQTQADGENSTAFGNGSSASGENSTAFGNGSNASGANSSAFGAYTGASGENSMAFGFEAQAEGDKSLAFGTYTFATAANSAASGAYTYATGMNSFVGGSGSNAQGAQSFAFGSNVTAYGSNSTVFGSYSEAHGENSTAFGEWSYAAGNNSTAFGHDVVAIGDNSSAFGYGSDAWGKHSFVMGEETQTSQYAGVALGRYNENKGTYTDPWLPSNSWHGDNLNSVFEIGIGADEANRKNALTVMQDGTIELGKDAATDEIPLIIKSDGSVNLKNLSVGPDLTPILSVDSSTGVAINGDLNINGSPVMTAAGLESVFSGPVEFGNGTAAGDNSVAFGVSDLYGGAFGDNSAAFGYWATASGLNSFSGGQYTEANGIASFAFGESAHAIGDKSTAFGYYNEAIGENSVVFGKRNRAVGDSSTAFGALTYAGGKRSSAFGSGSYAGGENSSAFGERTNANGVSSAAFGQGSSANGEKSIAMGLNTNITQYAGVALGQFNENKGTYTDPYQTTSVWVGDNLNSVFEIGIGADGSNRKNALTVMQDGTIELGKDAATDEIPLIIKSDGSVVLAKAQGDISMGIYQ